ncbi:trimeric intracellular cation channel family protein [Tropicimonas aquimaris]|uniref:Trimeric intracellular cation channel family protein n=1 Tax=Tropicimonas aquimaris TaxID=914152 RepID=A0ABW3IQT9_9RHOB
MTLEYLSLGLMVLATAVMAASAAIQAVRHGLDLFGATVLAIAAALGGGTVRDMLLGKLPVFWINDLTFILTTVPVAIAGYFVATRMAAGNGLRLAWLMRLDAMGLALFTLMGVRVAQQADTSAIIAVIIGCITGTVGGMIRDLLCNVTPLVLKQDLYATISLAGGALYLLLLEVVPEGPAAAISFAAMLGVRLLVLARQRPE